MNLTIHQIAFHRNGIGGDPFYAVRFYDRHEYREMLGIVFSRRCDEDSLPEWEWGEDGCPVAVIDLDLARTTIKFGENSWRGDTYASDLYEAIREYERSRQ